MADACCVPYRGALVAGQTGGPQVAEGRRGHPDRLEEMEGESRHQPDPT